MYASRTAQQVTRGCTDGSSCRTRPTLRPPPWGLSRTLPAQLPQELGASSLHQGSSRRQSRTCGEEPSTGIVQTGCKSPLQTRAGLAGPLSCVSSGTCSAPVSPDFCHLHCGEHLSYPAGLLQGRNQPLLKKLGGPCLALVGVKKMAPVSSTPKPDAASPSLSFPSLPVSVNLATVGSVCDKLSLSDSTTKLPRPHREMSWTAGPRRMRALSECLPGTAPVARPAPQNGAGRGSPLAAPSPPHRPPA